MRIDVILGKCISIFSPLISCFEIYSKTAILKSNDKNQPIFIIGAPRSGTTILYQILSNQLSISYFNNLTHLFYKNILFGFQLSHLFFKKKPHNSFSSTYGDTMGGGLNAPSECHQYWYRFLPKEKHYIKKDETSLKLINQIKKEIDSIVIKYNQPILFKNLPMGMRINLIKELFPGAKFILINRNLVQNAYSIINARKEKRINKQEWWSVKPNNYKELSTLEEEEKAVAQIYYINKLIEKDLNLFPKENILRIKYTDFCKNPNKVINKVKNFTNSNFRPNSIQQKIIEHKNKIPKKKLDSLNKFISKYYD